jgi:hypothetical protein
LVSTPALAERAAAGWVIVVLEVAVQEFASVTVTQ